MQPCGVKDAGDDDESSEEIEVVFLDNDGNEIVPFLATEVPISPDSHIIKPDSLKAKRIPLSARRYRNTYPQRLAWLRSELKIAPRDANRRKKRENSSSDQNNNSRHNLHISPPPSLHPHPRPSQSTKEVCLREALLSKRSGPVRHVKHNRTLRVCTRSMHRMQKEMCPEIGIRNSESGGSDWLFEARNDERRRMPSPSFFTQRTGAENNATEAMECDTCSLNCRYYHCSKSFPNVALLEDHQRYCHQILRNAEKGGFICTYSKCSERFISFEDILFHQLSQHLFMFNKRQCRPLTRSFLSKRFTVSRASYFDTIDVFH